jgi:hypothetical protein
MKIKIILLLVICVALVADLSSQCVQCEGGENPGTNATQITKSKIIFIFIMYLFCEINV